MANQNNISDFSRRRLWIVFVASLGQLIGTALATVAGVIIPMINIMRHPELSSLMQGLIGAGDLIGIMIGSLIFGNLSDRYGYLLFFRLCPAIILFASLVSIFVPNIWVLVLCLFIAGIGIGGEYSLDSNYVSELMLPKWRKVMLGITKTAAAFGNIIGAALCLAIVLFSDKAEAWPDLMWIVTGIAAVMLLTRIRFYQSPKWLLDRGRVKEAESAVKGFLGKNATLEDLGISQEQINQEINVYGKSNKNASSASKDYSASKISEAGFVKKYFSRVMLSGVPWACEGLGVYGIGVFIPILVMALGIEHFVPGMSPVLHVAESVKTTLYISCIILPGFIIGVILTSRKKSNIALLQAIGFWACALSLVILLLSYHLQWEKWISLVAFMSFELFLNIGPHLVTYLMPPMIYPVEIRGRGTGIAASLGKLGAVMGVFLIPVLLKAGGAILVLAVSASVMGLGAVITQIYAAKVIPDHNALSVSKQ